MTRLFVEDVIRAPQEQVYTIQRDKMAELANFLPNIDGIEVLEREVKDDGVRIVNLWRAAETEIPVIARRFIKPSMLNWKDYAYWYDATCYCEWRLELNFFTDQVKVSGKTTYEKIDDKSVKAVIDGTLEVDAGSLPGVPRLLARKVGPEIEKFVIKLITPNLKGVNRGIEQYIAAQ